MPPSVSHADSEGDLLKCLADALYCGGNLGPARAEGNASMTFDPVGNSYPNIPGNSPSNLKVGPAPADPLLGDAS